MGDRDLNDDTKQFVRCRFTGCLLPDDLRNECLLDLHRAQQELLAAGQALVARRAATPDAPISKAPTPQPKSLTPPSKSRFLKLKLSSAAFEDTGKYFVAATLNRGLQIAAERIVRTELSNEQTTGGPTTNFLTKMAFRVVNDFTSLPPETLVEFAAFRETAEGKGQMELYAEGSVEIGKLMDRLSDSAQVTTARCVLSERPPVFPLMAVGRELGSMEVALQLCDAI